LRRRDPNQLDNRRFSFIFPPFPSSAMMNAAVLQAAMLPGAGEIGTHFPVKTKQWTQAVQGHSTDFVLNLFADCIFIIVTQLGKMGTLVLVFPSPLPLPRPKRSRF